VNYSSWEQGIVVGPGNPKGVRTLEDLARGDITIVNRDVGSGSRRLLDAALRGARISGAGIAGYDREVETHMAVARAVQAGIADAGIALRAVASIFGLDFIPLGEVRFDLVIPAEHLDHPTVKMMLDTLQDKRLQADLAALPGYETTRTGSTVIELRAA
jgi:molybdate-binding protein